MSLLTRGFQHDCYYFFIFGCSISWRLQQSPPKDGRFGPKSSDPRVHPMRGDFIPCRGALRALDPTLAPILWEGTPRPSWGGTLLYTQHPPRCQKNTKRMEGVLWLSQRGSCRGLPALKKMRLLNNHDKTYFKFPPFEEIVLFKISEQNGNLSFIYY